jgi:hypothetical protein
MLFDSRRQGNLNFKFGQTDILSVDFHKHLGIVFSSDGKWTRHIDYILSKASKQVCVLRKLKFILKQEILEKNYLTFIRPLLKYSCEVWGNCSQTNNDKLEKLQLEAARIVTGLTVYSSRDSLYQETGWGKLSSRRERRKLCLMYNISTTFLLRLILSISYVLVFLVSLSRLFQRFMKRDERWLV